MKTQWLAHRPASEADTAGAPGVGAAGRHGGPQRLRVPQAREVLLPARARRGGSGFGE